MQEPRPTNHRSDLAARLALRSTQHLLDLALASYWEARAEAFEWARPRPGDWPGVSPDVQLDARCRAAAQECRARADEIRAPHDEEIW